MNDDSLRIIEAGMLAGIRPSLSIAVCSLLIGFGAVEMNGAFEMLGHPLAMTLACGFAVFELFYERDSSASADVILRFVRVGLAAAASLAAAATMAGLTDQEFGSLEVASGGGVAMMMGLIRSTVRERAREVVDDAATAWIARFEEGGLVTMGTLLIFFPIVPLLLLLVLSLGATAGFALSFVADRSLRRPCGKCGHPARVEAVRCPKCQGALEPNRHLSPPKRFADRLAEAAAAASSTPESESAS
jgi:hypothetical protein